MAKVTDIADRMLALHFTEYKGNYGEQLEPIIAAALEPQSTVSTCYAIDSLMLGVRAVNMMLELGHSYEDPERLNEFIRLQYFTGCAGPLSIEHGTNGRNVVTYYIYNFYKSGDENVETEVGSYTMGITIPLKFTDEIVWSNGEFTVPANMRETNPACGFFLSEVSDHSSSYYLSSGFLASLLVAATVCVAVVWKTHFSFSFDTLQEPRPILFEDAMVLGLPMMEALQFVALSPSLSAFPWMIQRVCFLAAFEVEPLIEGSTSRFWHSVYLGLSTAIVWVLCMVLKMTRISRKLPESLEDFVDMVTVKLMPVFAQALFVPITLTLFKLVKCHKGTGESLDNSFLEFDCTFSCWTGPHLVLSITALITALLYILLAITCRPSIENRCVRISVKQQPLYSMNKGLWQLSLVIAYSKLQDTHSLLFGVVYVCLASLWLICVLLVKSTNYERLSMWIRLISIGLVGHSVLIFMAQLQENLEWLYIFSIDCSMFLLVIGAGLFGQIKKFKSMLIRKPGQDISLLFRFQLGNSVVVGDLKSHELDYVIDSKQLEEPNS